MPFVSRAQEKWAFANKKKFAKKWAKMTDQSTLPPKKVAVKKEAKNRVAQKVAGVSSSW